MADKFEKAVQIIQSLPKDGPLQLPASDKLKFYGWYKTATVGAVDKARPGMLDSEGRAKWDAWLDIQTETPEACKKQYVEKLIEILEANDSEDSKKYLAEIK